LKEAERALAAAPDFPGKDTVIKGLKSGSKTIVAQDQYGKTTEKRADTAEKSAASNAKAAQNWHWTIYVLVPLAVLLLGTFAFFKAKSWLAARAAKTIL
jgi:hypothetical protein